jgi:hypothetical protein
VALHVTVLVPNANVDPLGGVQLTATAPSTLSVAAAVNVNGAPVVPVASMIASGGTVIAGPVVSRTVTVNVLLAAFACASVAEQVTVVVPSGNVAPLAGAQLTATVPSTVSLADAVNVNDAPDAPVASIVAFDGTVMTGLVVSVTVTVNVLLLALPCASVAEHVTVAGPSANVDPLAGVQAAATPPSTRSLAVAVNVKIAPAALVASTVAFGGTVSVGGVVSRTITVNVPVPVLPWLSTLRHDTVVVPSGNVAPLAGTQTVVTAPLMLSIADALNVNGAPAGPVASMVALPGTVTIGLTVSTTVTRNNAVPVLACASVALHVTVVVPIGKTAPLVGVQLAATGPSTLSVAVALNVNAVPSGPAASSVVSEGTVTTGGVTSASFTVTLKLPVTLLPARSLAEH